MVQTGSGGHVPLMFFFFTPLTDPDHVASIVEVEFVEDVSPLEQLRGRGDERKRVVVLDGYIV